MISTLTGSNTFQLKSELNRLIDDFVKNHGDIALEKLDGQETSTERMIEAVQSLPFLAPKKLVILRNPSAQKAFAEQVEDTLKTIPDTNDVVLVEPKIDKRSAYSKVLKSQTEYKEFVEQDAYGLSNWIVQYAKEQNATISQADAKYLIERVGQNQQMLVNEIDKLTIYDSKISRSNIDLLTEPTPQSTIFELLDAAFAGNSKKVLKLYKEQRALKVEPQQIIAMLAWQLHLLAIIKTSKGKSANQIASEAKISPFVAGKSMKIAEEVTLTELKKLISKALKLDVKLKTQSINADDALQEYLLNINS